MELLEEYVAHAHLAAVRERAEAGFKRSGHRRGRRRRTESRHRAAPSG